MALRGSLKDFGLPDVFQLIQLSRKSGILRIKGPGSEGSIWFREGDVFFAQSNWRRELLGQRLVAGQKITPSALARALEMRGAEPPGGRRLGQILVDEGYITQQVLEAFVQEQIQDTIFDIMRWDQGDFDFEVLPEVIPEDIGLSVSVENIVMEGSRRLEEWDRIRKRVPSTEMVFRMATAPGQGTFEISLKPTEWNLLLLVDGTRSVRELAIATRRTDFEVARTVYGLFSAGLLEVAVDAEVEDRRADRARREKARLRRAPAYGGYARGTVSAPQGSSVADGHAAATEIAYGDDAVVASEPETASGEADVPEFLVRVAEEPSVDDLAAFEQVLEAVLAQAEAGPAGSAVSPWGEPQPDGAAGQGEPVPATETSEVTTEEAGLLEVEQEADAFADHEATPEPAGHEHPGVHPPREFVPTGDFEADLLTLGLGEYPEELRVREAEEGLPPTATEESSQTTPSEPEIEYVAVTDTVIEEEFERAEEERLEEEEPSAEPEEEPEEEVTSESEEGPEEEPEEEVTSESEEGPPAEPEEEPAAEPEEEVTSEPEEEPEEELLYEMGAEEELLSEPSAEAELLYEGEPEEPAFDELEAELVLQPAEKGALPMEADEDIAAAVPIDGHSAESGFGPGIGLGGGLGDELTALTGGGTGRARPAATVDRLPEEGNRVILHRDMLVDRDLVLRIIDGVERL